MLRRAIVMRNHGYRRNTLNLMENEKYDHFEKEI